MGEAVENISTAPVSEEDELYGFKRQEMYSGTLAGSVAPYGRHVFLCYRSHETWLPRVESDDSKSPPSHGHQWLDSLPITLAIEVSEEILKLSQEI
ncbi:hypothetical protein Bca4012_083734 [Brassica carinata]